MCWHANKETSGSGSGYQNDSVIDVVDIVVVVVVVVVQRLLWLHAIPCLPYYSLLLPPPLLSFWLQTTNSCLALLQISIEDRPKTITKTWTSAETKKSAKSDNQQFNSFYSKSEAEKRNVLQWQNIARRYQWAQSFESLQQHQRYIQTLFLKTFSLLSDSWSGQHCRQDKAALIQTHRIMNIHHLALFLVLGKGTCETFRIEQRASWVISRRRWLFVWEVFSNITVNVCVYDNVCSSPLRLWKTIAGNLLLFLLLFLLLMMMMMCVYIY